MIIKLYYMLNSKLNHIRNLIVKSNIKHSFLFGLILDKLNIKLDDLPSTIDNPVYGIAAFGREFYYIFSMLIMFFKCYRLFNFNNFN